VTQRRPILFARNLFLPEDLGGNRYPYETMRRLAARGYPVTVATPRLHERFPSLDNVTYHLYPIQRPHPAVSHFTNLLGATIALRSVRRHAIAISGSYDSALALGLARISPKTPLVFLFHSEFYSEWVQARSIGRALIRRYMAAVERRVFKLSARIVAVSAFSARQIVDRSPPAAEKVRVVPTGVETDFFCPAEDKAVAKRALGLDSAEPLVLGVGRLAGVKQFDRLITAFAAARAQGLQARLVIAGGGPERPRLEKLIATYGGRSAGVQQRIREPVAGHSGGHGVRHAGPRHAWRRHAGARRRDRRDAGAARRSPGQHGRCAAALAVAARSFSGAW
jgi:glycosyltransferase involved in cell wall biosynthesis